MKPARADALQGREEAPELIVDNEIKNPPPLDHRIASVWMRTPTNNVTEGYDLLLSASFGKERVTLKGDGFVIDADFSLSTADIELKFLKCSPTVLEEESRAEEARTTVKDHKSEQTRWNVGAGAEASASTLPASGASLRAGGKFEKTATATTTTQRQVSRGDWFRTGVGTIQVGPTGDTLSGRIITEFKGWRVKPTSTKALSGVVATVKVRENWIRFENVKLIESPPRFVDRLRNLLTGEDRKRRQYFDVLLANLAQSALSNYQDGRAATIAVDVLVVRPFEEQASTLPGGPSRNEIQINGHMLEDFLGSPEGHEASTLIALGVNSEMISPVALGDQRKKRSTEYFIPDSSPPHALAVLKQLQKHGAVPRAELLHPTTLHDLRALSLITTTDDTVRLNASSVVDPDFMLRRAVSGMECIKIARQVLILNPVATHIDIAEAVSLELGKGWVQLGTKKRNGNSIKRWVTWLEPYLLDPESSSDAAARVAYAIDKRVMKGRPASLRKAMAKEVRRLVVEGKTPGEIAVLLKVSRQTIYIWKKRLRLK